MTPAVTWTIILVGVVIIILLVEWGYMIYPCFIRRYQPEKYDFGIPTSVTLKPNMIVSLTTSPDRINTLGPTITTLLEQTARPDWIEINVPHLYRGEEPYVIPKWLSDLKAVRIMRCERDWGPATKFIPSLIRSDPDVSVLVVDDDWMYTKTLAEDLLKHQRKPYVAATTGWTLPSDLDYNDTPLQKNFTNPDEQSPVAVIRGAEGFLVNSGQFDLQALTSYEGAPKSCIMMDDVWVSGHLSRKGTPKYVVYVQGSPSPILGLPTLLGRTRSFDNNTAIQWFKDDWNQQTEVRH